MSARLCVLALLAATVLVPAEAGAAGPGRRAAPIAAAASPPTGPAGTRVVITGRYLRGVTKVLFGRTRGTDLVITGGRSLSVTAPPHAAGRVTLRLVSKAGRSARGPVTFTYPAPPPPPPTPALRPEVLGLSPASGLETQWTSVTVTGRELAGVTEVRFGERPVAFRPVSATELVASAPPQAAGRVAVTVTAPGGTSRPTADTWFTYTCQRPEVRTTSPPGGLVYGGERVELVGVGLSDLTEVRFGDVAVRDVSHDDAGRAYVTAPAHARGVVTVGAVNGCGTSVAGATYTYAAPQPVVTEISPYRGPATGGTTVTVRGTGFTEATGVTFGGVRGTSVQVLSDTELTVATPARTRSLVHVRVVNPDLTSRASWASYFAFQDDPRIVAAPLPGDASLEPSVFMSAVDCAAPGSCVAVGGYETTSGARRTLVEELRDGTWGPSSLGFGQLTDVACPAPAACFATGGDRVWRWDGATWVVAATAPEADLREIDCVSTLDCVAWGATCTSACGPFVLASVAGTWTPMPLPLPGGATTGRIGELDCWSATDCVAVGAYDIDPATSEGAPVVFRRDALGWTSAPAAMPTGSSGDPTAQWFQALSCAPEGCRALGQFENAARAWQPYLSTITAAGEAVVPFAAPADQWSRGASYVEDLDCPTFDWCQGVGDYRQSVDEYQPLTVQVVDGVPALATGRGATMLRIACPAPGSCAAVGYARTAAVSAGRFSYSRVPAAALPEGDEPWFTSAFAVADDSATSAVVVGEANRGTSDQVGLLMTGLPVG